MNKKVVIFFVLFLPIIVLAAHHGDGGSSSYFAKTGREYDIKPRIFDFTVFAGIMYYLIAGPIKAYFSGRRSGIASQLNEIEQKLQDAKNSEKDAKSALNKSQAQASEIINNAKKEAELISQKAAVELEDELAYVQSQYDEKLEFEERKMAKETIEDILSSNISGDDIPLNENQVVDIISKKVA